MRNASSAFSINGDARFRGHDKFGDFRAFLLQRFSIVASLAGLTARLCCWGRPSRCERVRRPWRRRGRMP